MPEPDVVRGEVAEIPKWGVRSGGRGDAARDSDDFATAHALLAHGPRVRARRVTGVLLADGTRLPCRAVIVTTGTFLAA